MLSSFLGWLGSLLASLFSKLVSDKRADQNAQDLGRAKGADQTSEVMTEISDAQSQNNAAPRNTAVDIGKRLRDEAKRSRDSGSGQS